MPAPEALSLRSSKVGVLDKATHCRSVKSGAGARTMCEELESNGCDERDLQRILPAIIYPPALR